MKLVENDMNKIKWIDRSRSTYFKGMVSKYVYFLNLKRNWDRRVKSIHMVKKVSWACLDIVAEEAGVGMQTEERIPRWKCNKKIHSTPKTVPHYQGWISQIFPYVTFFLLFYFWFWLLIFFWFFFMTFWVVFFTFWLLFWLFERLNVTFFDWFAPRPITQRIWKWMQ